MIKRLQRVECLTEVLYLECRIYGPTCILHCLKNSDVSEICSCFTVSYVSITCYFSIVHKLRFC